MNVNTCRQQSFWFNGRHRFKFSASFVLFSVQQLPYSCGETTSSGTSLNFLTQAGGTFLTKAKPLNF